MIESLCIQLRQQLCTDKEIQRAPASVESIMGQDLSKTRSGAGFLVAMSSNHNNRQNQYRQP